MKFNELDEDAKKSVLMEHHDALVCYDDWYDSVIEDATEILKCLGFESYGLRSFDIQFSGFWHQGDGASFIGVLELPQLDGNPVERIQAYAPNDPYLLSAATRLQALALKTRLLYGGSFVADIGRRNGHYSNSATMYVCSFEILDEEKDSQEVADTSSYEAEITEIAIGLADWIYARLKEEYEYLTSEQAIIEHFEANDYEFDEFGCIL